MISSTLFLSLLPLPCFAGAAKREVRGGGRKRGYCITLFSSSGTSIAQFMRAITTCLSPKWNPIGTINLLSRN